MSCQYCDYPGGKKTYAHQIPMPLNGKVQCIDHCIAHIIASLNAGGVRTVTSCCGHGVLNGSIELEDGRLLVVLPETPDNLGEWLTSVGLIKDITGGD